MLDHHYPVYPVYPVPVSEMLDQYRPEYSTYHPASRTRSLRRARLFEGGTYFRALTPSAQGNNISIEVLEFLSEIPGEEGLLKGKLIITNHNTVFSENVTGPVTVDLFHQHLNWRERYVIHELNGSAHILMYRVNLQAAVQQSLQEDLGFFTFAKLFHIPDKLSLKLTLKAAEVTPQSVVTVKARTRVYDLVPLSITLPPEEGSSGVVETGWDIEALRTAMNGDPWIEMLPRSGTPLGTPEAPGIPLLVKFDVQDDGIDAKFLTPFADTHLSGGDGLPDFPIPDRNGLMQFMIHVDHTELQNGTIETVYDMYEWIGNTAAGEWKKF